MGRWLNYFRKNNSDAVQGNLLGPTETTDIVIDNTDPSQRLAYERLHNLIKQSGGQKRTHAIVNAEALRILLGEEPDQLYEALGVPKSKRERLPTSAQEALMAGNIAAFYAIVEDKAQGHDQIIRSSKQGFHRAKGIFPWNR